METSLAESICSFREAEEQPSDHIFAITLSQLRDIVLEACVVTKAELDDMRKKITNLDEKIADLEATQDVHSENDLNQLRLIAELRGRHTKSKSQGDKEHILRALLASNDGKMPTKEARRLMKMDTGNFSRLVSGMSEIRSEPYYLDRRQTILILR